MYKITFFNPETLKKSVVHFLFQWDYSNHCWNVTIKNIFGESTQRYWGKPEDCLAHYKDSCVRPGEYATIKTVKYA
jgi:hypothetical protein